MSSPLNQIPGNPTLRDLLDQLKKEIFLSMSCHHVATIDTFDPVTQTATATVAYKKTFYKKGASGYEPTLIDYPLMLSCPVFFAGGGNTAMTFPVKKGDECLAAFNDRDIDKWFAGQTGGSLNSNRLHSFADALLFVGFRSKGTKLAGFDGTRASLRGNAAGTTVVAAGETLIQIANAQGTLNTHLQSLCSELQTMIGHLQTLVAQTAAITLGPGAFQVGGVAVTGVGGPVLNASLITAVSVQLTSDSTQIAQTAQKIAGLLE